MQSRSPYFRWSNATLPLRDDEADLVSLVRRGLSETELASHIEWALQRKQERHDGVTMDQPERPMWRIGG